MGQKQSKKHDVALCFVYFNPTRSKRILMNYLYTLNRLHEFPCYTLELVFHDRVPEIAPSSNVFHVRSNSFMFHKERLCRVLEKKLPSRFKKIAFLDADIFFAGTDWYSQMSLKLDTFDIVQGFEFSHWLDLTYKNVMLTRETAVKSKYTVFSHIRHPGFIWAFRRDWYRTVGFFDWAISGSGDTLSVAAWMKQTFDKGFKSLPASMKSVYEEFCKMSKPKISYLDDVHVFHLYHGSRQNRQYVDRHAMLDIKQDIRTLVQINDAGVYEWVDSHSWNPRMLAYFNTRDDDGIEVPVQSPKNTS